MYRIKAYKNQNGITLQFLSEDGRWEADKLTMLSSLMKRYNIASMHIPMGKALFELKNIPSCNICSILFELGQNGFVVSSPHLAIKILEKPASGSIER